MTTDDSCLQRPAAKTASATVYLMEELGDARMRCDQLVRYTAEAAKLIENSSHRDHFFEIAGHLIQGIPHTVFLLQKALQATALAATRIDYEEIKQELRPEKVQELERALKDVRVRQVQRRSEPWTPAQAVQAIRGMVAKMEATGSLPLTDMMALILGLEFGLKAADATTTAQALESVVASIETADAAPSQLHLAALLRQVLADDLLTTTTQEPRMTDKTILDWKTGGAKEAEAPVPDARIKSAIEAIERDLKDIKHHLGKSEANRPYDDMGVLFNSIRSASAMMARRLGMKTASDDVTADRRPLRAGDEEVVSVIALMRDGGLKGFRIDSPMGQQYGFKTIEAAMHQAVKDAPFAVENILRRGTVTPKMGADEEKESKFEEGKPADPTENMDPEDAKKWKEEHDKNKDKFKSAAVLSPEVQGELQGAALALRNAAKGQQPKKNAVTAVRLLAMALAKMDEPRAHDVLWRAADVMQTSGMWDLAGKEAALRNQPLGQGVSAADLIKELLSLAKDMFGARGDFRTVHTAVQDGLQGYPMGIGPFAKVSDSLVARAKMLAKDMEEWDHVTGAVANGLEVVARDLKKGSTVTASEDEKQSKFEEGKPADPTENMSPEDAKKWKTEHDKHKDNFKSAGLEGELREMQDILKANGYNPADAAKLQDEGMGPHELEHRIRTTQPGGMGSLEYTHGLKKAPGGGGGGVNLEEVMPWVAGLTGHIKKIHMLLSGPKPQKARAVIRLGGLVRDVATILEGLGIDAKRVEAVGREIQREVVGLKLSADEEKESKFEEGKPADPTENMSPEDAKKWKTEHDKHKDNFKSAAKADFTKLYHQMSADLDTFDLAWSRYEKDPEKNKSKLNDALKYMRDLRDLADVLIRNMMQMQEGKTASAEEAKRSRFEEGKPADPTENMSPEDAKRWKEEHDKHKDNFKAGSEDDDSNQAVFNEIKPGSKVTIRTPQGQEVSGKAVMRGPHGWVLNMGGKHGRPGIASPSNVVKVKKASEDDEVGYAYGR